MHQMPEYAGRCSQVASQFNALEMVGPGVAPEDGVTRYEHGRTQGPACAIAAGAATIYRFFAPVGDQIGQSAANQIDGLADLGAELSRALGRPVSDLWVCKTATHSPRAQGSRNDRCPPARNRRRWAVNELAGHLRVGVHQGVEGNGDRPSPGPRVTQVFCSALPVAYGRWPQPLWRGVRTADPRCGLRGDPAGEASTVAKAARILCC